MCMICNNIQNMTSGQAIANLFETKESLGQEHTNKVANMLINKMLDDGTFDKGVGNLDGGLPDNQQKMFAKISKFVGVDPFPEEE